jgi:pyridoxal phosphate enzyme (YggS family)
MTEWDVTQRLAGVRHRIDEACHRSGRDPGEVTLIGVTKRIPLARIVAACQAGLWDLGENRIQDALPRQAELTASLLAEGLPADKVRWHFIGHLQRNKAGKAVGAFHLIHAVDSLRLVDRLAAVAAEVGVQQRVLVEVNLTAESQKHGVQPEQAVELVAYLAERENLEPYGLMTMARFGDSEPELRKTFAGLRHLNDKVRQTTGLPLPHLSMGMSDDFEAAIAEGATIVRIGTAIFGRREPIGGI